MKKLKFLFVALISLFIFKCNVLAASGTMSVSKESVYVGDTFTVTVNASSVAAWNIHVTADGPVSDCLINQADATADAKDTNKEFSATCTATGAGTITLTLSGDVTSASDNNAVDLASTKTVTVTTKEETVTKEYSVKLELSSDKKNFKESKEFTWLVTVSNQGSEKITGLQIKDTIDSKLTIVDADSGQATSNVITWNIDLDTNSKKTFSVKVKSSDSKTEKVTNKVSVIVDNKELAKGQVDEFLIDNPNTGNNIIYVYVSILVIASVCLIYLANKKKILFK